MNRGEHRTENIEPDAFDDLAEFMLGHQELCEPSLHHSVFTNNYLS